jgi:hypothetical protein
MKRKKGKITLGDCLPNWICSVHGSEYPVWAVAAVVVVVHEYKGGGCPTFYAEPRVDSLSFPEI